MEEKKEKIFQIILGLILVIVVSFICNCNTFNPLLNFVLFLIPYFILSYDVYKEAFEELREGNIFNEDLLMCIATIGALLIGFLPNSEPEFLEANLVMLLFNIGELFEIIAEGNSQKSINSLLEIRPDYANLVKGKNVEKVHPNELKINDIIEINPGEKVPVDGVVIEGKSIVNTKAITGEAKPKLINENDSIISGCININGKIKVKVTKLFGESTASKIIDLVKNAGETKSKNDRFITKFASIYTPIVIILALIVAVIPSFITGEYIIWINRALTFLVVSCPCALVISVPLTYFGGLGSASKNGILIKGSNYLELLSDIDFIAFDKTGTLTEGVFEVSAIHPKKYNETDLLHLVYHVEEASSHPIAESLKDAYLKNNVKDDCKIKEQEEIPGYGIKAKVNDEIIYVGDRRLMKNLNIDFEECKHSGTVIHISTEKTYLGHIVISDKIKKDSKKTIEYLAEKNIKSIMLTGDNEKNASEVSRNLGIDYYYSELLPEDKINKVTSILDSNKKLSFVGDGINDAPLLAKADIGIAMGALGCDAAIESADIVIMNDNVSSIIKAINISKKTKKIAKENIFFSIAIKIIVLILSVLGITSMFLAIFADVGVTILAVLNAMRMLRK